MKYFHPLFIITGVLASTATFFAVSYTAWQTQETSVAAPTSMVQTRAKVRAIDAKAEKVKKIEAFMAKHKSPLYPYARHIVLEAEANNIDYRLIPAIAMNESTLCKAIPNNSYNCWGWGIYADKVTRFESYEDAVSTVSRGLKKFYYDRGMSSPSAIMRAYTPNSPDGIWARKIHKWYEEIESALAQGK